MKAYRDCQACTHGLFEVFTYITQKCERLDVPEGICILERARVDGLCVEITGHKLLGIGGSVGRAYSIWGGLGSSKV